MTRRTRAGLAVGAMLLAAAAPAVPPYWEAMKKRYEVKAGSKLDAANCSVCHTRVPAHNSYGAAVKAALRSAGTKTLDDVILAGLDPGDADGDGWSNGDELKKDALPGDAKSKPSGSPPAPVAGMGGTGGTGGTAPAKPVGHDDAPTMGEMVPKHSFHPLLVHFPIALFIFGALLDFVGIRRDAGHIRAAGLWNMAAASFMTMFAIPTGFIAAFRMGYVFAIGQPIVTHMAAGITASVLMLALIVYRARHARHGREPKSLGYVGYLGLTCAAVALAGYLGGELVYGMGN